jgi:hypothetical protein
VKAIFFFVDGGHDRDRTCDPYHVKEGVNDSFGFPLFTISMNVIDFTRNS